MKIRKIINMISWASFFIFNTIFSVTIILFGISLFIFEHNLAGIIVGSLVVPVGVGWFTCNLDFFLDIRKKFRK